MKRWAKIYYENDDNNFSLAQVSEGGLGPYYYSLINNLPIYGRKIRSIEIVEIDDGETSKK